MNVMMQTIGKPMHHSNRHQHSRSRRSTRWDDGLSCSLSGSSYIFVSGRSLSPQGCAQKHTSALRYRSERWGYIARKHPSPFASLTETLEIWGLTVRRRSPLG